MSLNSSENGEKTGITLADIVERRRRQCEYLGNDVVAALVAAPWEALTDRPDGLSSPIAKFVFIVQTLLAKAEDTSVSASDRRKAYEDAKTLLGNIDRELLKKGNQIPSPTLVSISSSSVSEPRNENTQDSSKRNREEATSDVTSKKRKSTTAPANNHSLPEATASHATKHTFLQTNGGPPGRDPSSLNSTTTENGTKHGDNQNTNEDPSSGWGTPIHNVGLSSIPRKSHTQVRNLANDATHQRRQTVHGKDNSSSEKTTSTTTKQPSTTSSYKGTSNSNRGIHKTSSHASNKKGDSLGASLAIANKTTNGTTYIHDNSTIRNKTSNSTTTTQSQSTLHAASLSDKPSQAKEAASRPVVMGRSARVLSSDAPSSRSSTVTAATAMAGAKPKTTPALAKPTTPPSTYKAPVLQPPPINEEALTNCYVPNQTGRVEHITVGKDDKRNHLKILRSGAQVARDHSFRISIRQESLSQEIRRTINDRLIRWDPYWLPIRYAAFGVTTKPTSPPPKQAGSTAAFFTINSASLAGASKVQYGKKVFEKPNEGDVALILKTLPVKPNPKKRADCHLWPKGTLLEFPELGIVGEITQRRQQEHDNSEWKYQSKPADIGSMIADLSKPLNIQMACYDEEPYCYSVILCKYRSPASLFRTLSGNGPDALPKLEEEDGRQAAAQFAQQQMLSIDGDEDEQGEQNGRFVFSLSCPISKRMIETPVRSSKCRHWQCFDLAVFLQSNVHMTGARWRCGACEQFVSVFDLQICKFTDRLLKEFKESYSATRDRVEFRADGEYKLLSERRKRKNMRQNEAQLSNSVAPTRRPSLQSTGSPEVIDLL